MDAVFFDVGNTLIYPYPSVAEVCREVLAEAGHFHDLSRIDEIMPLVDAYYEDRYRDDDTFWTNDEETIQVWVGMYSLLCRRLEITENAEVIARTVCEKFGEPERWRAYLDVLPAFRRLRERGLGVGVISNWDTRLAGLLDGLGFGEHLGVVVSSAEVGLHKPDPRIFEHACRELGVEPSRAAHVGDHHYADVLGASAAGMRAVLIDRHGIRCADRAADLANLDALEAVLGLE